MPERANDLNGVAWARNSISVWSDLRKTREEAALGHPAMFPAALAARLIECFTRADARVVLDPFAGVGSTLLAAQELGGQGIGIELSREYVTIAKRRLKKTAVPNAPLPAVHCADARRLSKYVTPASVDLVITSPPYWDILLRRRSADRKAVRHYGKPPADLGKIGDYEQFLQALREVFAQVFEALKPGRYCCAIVMDLRKKEQFFPLHADLAKRMQEIGFIFDDLIIWDRRQEYNNLRPLGYPSVFRINKTHEYVLIFRKPK
jgi:DNA modification methylase